MTAPFAVPAICENSDGWGPSTVPDHLKDVPFAPFGKGDKLGKASDWTQSAYQKSYGRYGNQQQGQGPVQSVFNFFHNEEEEAFHLVDNRPVKQPKFGGRRFQHQRFANQRRDREAKGLGQEEKQGYSSKNKQPQQQGGQKGRPPWQNYNRDQQRAPYSSSVEIRPEWAVVEQIPFTSLQKLSCSVGDAEDVVRCGTLEHYDKSFDRLTVKQETPLHRTGRAFRSVTTSEDPVIRRLAAEGKARVFITDQLLTMLMCARSSVYSWDVLITRVGDKVFFDKRDSSALSLLSVNETAPDAVPEERDNMNGVQQLAIEATTINQNFSQQVLGKTGAQFKFEEPNPFASPGDEEEELASVGYRYRKWVLNEEDDVSLICRCEVDGVITNKGEEQFMSIKAFNEFDMRGQDWRKKLESQRGAVLAYETKNNKNKVARWTAGALLAGTDTLKLGFVSRQGPKDNHNHVILGTQVCKPKDFAAQINLTLDSCWGIVRAVVDLLLKMDDGKYLLVKDPNKELLRLYALPEDAFDANYNDEAAQDTKLPLPRPAAAPKADEAA